MATPDATDGSGASWPDVALEIVAFAREETWKFLAVAAILIIILAVVLWFLFPRATATLRASYLAARSEHRREASVAEDRPND